jgi:hypothetical protein
MGWGLLSAVNWKANDWTELPNYALAIKNIFNQQGQCRDLCSLGPNVANNIASAGYDTADKSSSMLLIRVRQHLKPDQAGLEDLAVSGCLQISM